MSQTKLTKDFYSSITVRVFGTKKIGLEYSKRFFDMQETKNNDMQIYDDIGIKGAIEFINNKKHELNHQPFIILRECKNYATFYKMCVKLAKGTDLELDSEESPNIHNLYHKGERS